MVSTTCDSPDRRAGVLDHGYFAVDDPSEDTIDVTRTVDVYATFDYYRRNVRMGETSFEERDLAMTDDFARIIETMEKTLMRRLGHEGEEPPTS